MGTIEADDAVSWDEMSQEARASVDQGRDDEAVAILNDAAARFPELSAPLRDLAAIAERRRDWPEAERCWRRFIAVDDRPWWAHTALAATLREQGRIDEAEAGLAAVRERFPNEIRVAADHARLVDARGDWTQALAAWEKVRTQFPNAWPGFAGEAYALRELGRLDEARSVLIDARNRFPADAAPLHDLARLAERRRGWAEAERCWRGFLALDDRPSWAHTALALALRKQGRTAEADSVLAAAKERLPDEFAVYAEHARLAEMRQTWSEALVRWRKARARFTNAWRAYMGEAAALRELGRDAELHAFLLETQQRFPTEAAPLHDLARLAERRREWAEAERCWRGVLALDDRAWWAHTSLADALREQDRADEADAVLAAAQERLPDEFAVYAEHARLAGRRKNWPEALAAWERVRAQFPSAWGGFAGEANALRELGRLDEARSVLIAARDRFPGEIGPLHDLACLAERRRDWVEAERCWRGVLTLDDSFWVAHTSLVSSLFNQGMVAAGLDILLELRKKSAGDTACLATIGAFAASNRDTLPTAWFDRLEQDVAAAAASPDTSAQLLLAYANLAKGRQDFPGFRERLEQAASRFPRDFAIRVGLADARELTLWDRDVEPERLPSAGPAFGIVSDGYALDKKRAVFAAFESLGGGGDRGGCEFGVFQRHWSLEPLSCLRWASIQPEKLAEALERRFDGLDDPNNISLQAQGHYDWRVVDLAYGIRIDHTHLDRETVQFETAKKLVRNRLRLLSRKLIEDLEIGEKIFTYRMAGAVIPDAIASRLCRAIGSYGDARLLLVSEGGPAVAPFDIRVFSDKCLLVTRDDLGKKFNNSAKSITESWLAICERAHEYFAFGGPRSQTSNDLSALSLSEAYSEDAPR
jgi:tetratricopeptide (TPR) repeat protein